MKKIIICKLLFSVLLFSVENHESQKFFENKTGELLKKIIVNGQAYYMQQDGDIYDEDVATIEDEILSARDSGYSFGKSKRLLALQVYSAHQKTFYSNCNYKILGKKLIPIHKSCGFHYRKNKERSNRIEWEHIVPAWHFGHQLRCWQHGGRMNCRETNAKFRQMEADMHNLVPSIGEINGDRSNFKYGIISGEKRDYGKVNMEISFSEKRAEPRESVFGDIARTYFYMRDRYGLKISKSQEKMFIAWNNLDPVSSWEKKKNQIVKQLQGDENLYITNYHKLKQLGDNSNPTSNFIKIREELREKYGDILSNFSKPIAGIILFVMTIITLWYRQKKSSKITNKSKDKIQKFMLISKLGNIALSINNKDEIVIQEIDKDNPNQWWISTKANKNKKYFFIENLSTNKVIEIANSNSNDGAKIILNKKKLRKNDHQEWSFESSKDKEYFFIVNRWAFNVLDIKYKKTTNGTKVQSFHKKTRGTENQEWKIVYNTI